LPTVIKPPTNSSNSVSKSELTFIYSKLLLLSFLSWYLIGCHSFVTKAPKLTSCLHQGTRHRREPTLKHSSSSEPHVTAAPADVMWNRTAQMSLVDLLSHEDNKRFLFKAFILKWLLT
jgi:hypothetical protein